MGSGGVAEGESGSKISLEVFNFLDVLDELGINGLLSSLQGVLEFSLGSLSFFRFFKSML